MASRFEEPDLLACTQCENCGATDHLLRCSRCHAAWFCSLQCHKAYWPFHKSSCRRNDFADAVEQQEPRFAAWMRSHGKLAVLQDEEVERLERSSQPGGYLGLNRQEVMEGLYGRMDTSPTAPSYDNNQEQQQQTGSNNQEAAAAGGGDSPSDKAWCSITVPQDMGLAATRYKWWQGLCHVEVFVKLPDSITPKQVSVQLSPGSLCVSAAGDELLRGPLYAEVKVEDSTWFCDDGILHLQLLKRNRKGSYHDGCSAADTFWYSLLAGAKGADRLALTHPPTKYYSSHEEL